MTLEFSGLYFSTNFFKYLEVEGEVMEAELPSTWTEAIVYHIQRNKGYALLAGIMIIEWPKQMIDHIFHKLLDQFLSKIRHAQ